MYSVLGSGQSNFELINITLYYQGIRALRGLLVQFS